MDLCRIYRAIKAWFEEQARRQLNRPRHFSGHGNGARRVFLVRRSARLGLPAAESFPVIILDGIEVSRLTGHLGERFITTANFVTGHHREKRHRAVATVLPSLPS